ncbi:hypothetical protein VSA01S_10340 [Vibrio sagamiensis NBRC 104589]|uniref:Uncharacterized protein n=1 Tax=Vibrio sagamiensis NBRC 104589 TaxID=1219064 RepID=A0A511QEN9_9VIBR|nr:hypothetical protein VSA01S_10340 [Vibrio sagamiensis NBRC 104589]
MIIITKTNVIISFLENFNTDFILVNRAKANHQYASVFIQTSILAEAVSHFFIYNVMLIQDTKYPQDCHAQGKLFERIGRKASGLKH